MSAAFLRIHAKALTEAATTTAERAKERPSDLFLQIAAKNQVDAAREVEQSALLAEAEEAGELIDLRFLGPRATGSIPLDWFIKAVEPLSRAWKLAAHRLRHGGDAHRSIGSDIASALNLKLAGLAYGSTRIFVTGNALPDLTGESLLQTTLTQTFKLLNSTQEEFYDAVDAVGGKSAHQFSEFMKVLDAGGYAAEFTWQSPRGIQKWVGNPDEITRIRVLLDTIREPEEYEEVITGRVAGIADTGRLDLRTDDGKVSIRFPLKLTDQVQRLTITSPARIRVKTAKYWDGVQKRDIYKRQLLEVE